jgi:hypothetical protein
MLFGSFNAGAVEKVAVLKEANLITGKLIDIARRRQLVASRGEEKVGGAEIGHLMNMQNDLDVI